MTITRVVVNLDVTDQAAEHVERFANHLYTKLVQQYPDADIEVNVGNYPPRTFGSRDIIEVEVPEGEDPELPQDHREYTWLQSLIEHEFGYFE